MRGRRCPMLMAHYFLKKGLGGKQDFLKFQRRFGTTCQDTGEDPSEYRDGLPWNRHKRRRVAKARGVVVHLFSGRLSKEWQDWNPGNSIEVLTLDVEPGADQNLDSAAVSAYLWNLAVNQKKLFHVRFGSSWAPGMLYRSL